MNLKTGTLLSCLAAVTGACLGTVPAANAASTHEIARGKYLVTIGSCTDCHTPGHFFGKPDMSKFLGGSDVGFAIPHLGVFVGPNLTPDKATGLGNWTTAQIIAAITTGVTPQGRKLAPAMPYDAYKNLTKSDARAIAAYLQSLPAVSHQVPGPFGAERDADIVRHDHRAGQRLCAHGEPAAARTFRRPCAFGSAGRSRGGTTCAAAGCALASEMIATGRTPPCA